MPKLLEKSAVGQFIPGAKPVGNGKDFQHHEFVMLWFRCLSELPGVEILSFHVGVSKNRDTPKWMVYNGQWKTLLKWDDLGGKTPYFRKHPC